MLTQKNSADGSNICFMNKSNKVESFQWPCSLTFLKIRSRIRLSSPVHLWTDSQKPVSLSSHSCSPLTQTEAKDMMEMLTLSLNQRPELISLVRLGEESLVYPALVYSHTDKEKKCFESFLCSTWPIPGSVICLRQEVSVTGANTQGENSGR